MAALHGRDLLERGSTLEQVVRDFIMLARAEAESASVHRRTSTRCWGVIAIPSQAEPLWCGRERAGPLILHPLNQEPQDH